MDILIRRGINFEREVTFTGLTGDSGTPLRFDFSLFNRKEPTKHLLIELQGPHHYKSGYYDDYGEFIEDGSSEIKEKFIKQKNYDERKKAFCHEKGYDLEYIKYTTNKSYENLEKRVMDILKRHNLLEN